MYMIEKLQIKMNEKSNDNAREEKPSKIDEKQQQVTAKILASRDSDTPRLQRASSKPPSTERWNCLCSPTTHAGSFRCRFHRSSGMISGRIHRLPSLRVGYYITCY
ncbi:hypothetical protein OIU74_006299 [Salix koriyanagi]|uniref:Uncharacterized protein n=1 Tax=Salix koriyanagi TaxID=2511006 RepID=A0A9Q0ZBG4_9ROSI|nr:hypothetical protein OIU74_006299 [Salix koriyanagi]